MGMRVMNGDEGDLLWRTLCLFGEVANWVVLSKGVSRSTTQAGAHPSRRD